MEGDYIRWKFDGIEYGVEAHKGDESRWDEAMRFFLNWDRQKNIHPTYKERMDNYAMGISNATEQKTE